VRVGVRVGVRVSVSVGARLRLRVRVSRARACRRARAAAAVSPPHSPSPIRQSRTWALSSAHSRLVRVTVRARARARAVSTPATGAWVLGARCRMPEAGTPKTTWLSLRPAGVPRSAPDHASGCPTLRPASANQPLGRALAPRPSRARSRHRRDTGAVPQPTDAALRVNACERVSGLGPTYSRRAGASR
jgi:hypothetical protein